MADTVVRYLGLRLSSPVILGSSSLTNTVNGVRRAADAGAGAVVLKSLFEEQIDSEQQLASGQMDYSIHPEAEQYVQQMGKLLGPERYLDLVASAKAAVSIPVFASVNCVSARWWGDYGKQIEAAGADALELNISLMPRLDDKAAAVEQRYVDIVEHVRREVGLPLAAKIGPYFTSLAAVASRLVRAGASALVLFNRFYQFDIDVDGVGITPGHQYSAPEEIHTALRWVSILHGALESDLAGATGVHTGADVVKHLLAGANAVQVCSAIYREGYEQIGRMNGQIADWMDRHGYRSIAEFRGLLSAGRSSHPERHERLQYIKALTGLT